MTAPLLQCEKLTRRFGGVGNAWGVALAAAIVVILPEKLQVLQEYRFLLYAGMVVLILIFRPVGLLPRRLRRLPDTA